MSGLPSRSDPSVVVVGIGADGWDGLNGAARSALRSAAVIAGSARQLSMLGSDVSARRHRWASPMLPDLQRLLDDPPATPVHVLASGDPMFHGVGVRIVERVGADRVQVIPAPSSVSLAAARMGWSLSTTEVCSLLVDPPDSLIRHLSSGRRLLVLARDDSTPAAIADLLVAAGFGPSPVTVLGSLGGPDETRVDGVAQTWRVEQPDPLSVVAVDCVGPERSTVPGRADDEYASDGQLTKSGVRALTLALLRPASGQRLWDVGGGAGSIAVEWALTHTSCTAVVFESDEDRRDQIAVNARRHGVGQALHILPAAPDAFADAPTPDTVFVGGGVTTPGLLERCWAVLPSGGRLVVNAVTIESQALLSTWFAHHGGHLRRIQIDDAAPLGAMTTWRPILPVVQWSVQVPG